MTVIARSDVYDCLIAVENGVLMVSNDGLKWTEVSYLEAYTASSFIREVNKKLLTSFEVTDFDLLHPPFEMRV